METIQRDYSPKGVRFVYLYKSLAHPENNGYVPPVTIEERLLHIKEAKRTLGTRFEWLCDMMSNRAKHTLGDAPNFEYILDPKGKIAGLRAWSDSQALRKDLERIIGKVENPTRISDLDLKTAPPPKVAAQGVVKRLVLPPNLAALKTIPALEKSRNPFYVKLRAEAEQQVLRSGRGKLYIGFLLDPIYHVHWNNLVKPVRFEITAPPGITVSPASGEGPKVKDAADIDPREFLVEVEGVGKTSAPLNLKVFYFGCNDDEGWCKAITQEYAIHFDRDEDGGRVIRQGKARPGNGTTKRPARRGDFTPDNPPPQVLRRFDKDGDGTLNEEERAALQEEMQKRGMKIDPAPKSKE